jgi:ATP/maltotriose-dependent transcriptional regulator MalT
VSRLIAELTQELPDSATTMAIERGKSLTLDAVTEACIDLLVHGTTSPQKDEFLTDRLTKRELDVLRLAAGGFTNAQIAAELVITVGTVKWYLHQIYQKLDVGNRTQATARARELHLLP